MHRKFVELRGFRKFVDSEQNPTEFLASVQTQILKDPEIGAVIAGTGGLRKFRFALDGGGKSGGARICYVDFPEIQQTWLVLVFPKNEKANLSQSERNQIADLIRKIREELGI